MCEIDATTELLVLNGVVVSPLEVVYDASFYERKIGEDEDDDENDEEIITAKEEETETAETCIA